MPSTVHALIIVLYNEIFSLIAVRLTNFENHRMNTAYEASLIAKTVTFNFINSYGILVYIAFIK